MMINDTERKAFEKWFNDRFGENAPYMIAKTFIEESWNDRAALSTEAHDGDGAPETWSACVAASKIPAVAEYIRSLEERLAAPPPADTVTLGREEYEALKKDAESHRQFHADIAKAKQSAHEMSKQFDKATELTHEQINTPFCVGAPVKYSSHHGYDSFPERKGIIQELFDWKTAENGEHYTVEMAKVITVEGIDEVAVEQLTFATLGDAARTGKDE